MSASPLYIGLMSGTSTDGVDGVLADFTQPERPRLLSQTALPMPEALRREFLALNASGHDELARAAQAGNALARLYAQACSALLADSGASRNRIGAIGAHGQTVRHEPALGYSVQINAPALLAELTGITVIADFRSRDIAAGGQGAPLVPAFHQSLFGNERPKAILNLGGIANITLLHPNRAVRGFDTGPANVLLDTWIHERKGLPYDDAGSWAATGTVCAELVDSLLRSEPWFDLPPPKSTGRDLFNRAWLEARLAPFAHRGLSDADVQASLQALTASSVAQALERHAPETEEIWVCGGGALNAGLMHELQERLRRPARPTADLEVPVMAVEALAFAWLAHAHMTGHCAGLPEVTGARHPAILGCRYPA